MKRSIGIICAAAMALSMVTAFAEDDGREYTTEGGYIYMTDTGTIYDDDILENGELPKFKVYHAPDDNAYYYRINDAGDEVSLFARNIKGTELRFPSTVNGIPVTAVGNDASSLNLESVVIPDGVKLVAGIRGCKKLKSITIPDSVTKFDYAAFENNEALESVKLPKGVTKIEALCFYNCTALKSIEIPASVEKIDERAFYGCTALKDIKLNEGLVSVGKNAFCMCPAEKLKLPDSLEEIEAGGFRRMPELRSITIPAGVKTLGKGAFSNDTALEKIVFEGMPEMDMAFSLCEKLSIVEGMPKEQLREVWLSFDKTPYQASMISDDEPFMIDKSGKLVAYIGTSKEPVIPETTKTIGESAFIGKDITAVTIPGSVQEIEQTAFYGCDRLTSITIPASVNRIGRLAFSNCYKLKDITFEYSSTLLSLESSAFQFTLASPETLVTNGRRYSNQKTAFQNTYFDIDYVPVSVNDAPADESNTEPPKETEAPKGTEEPEPTEQPGTIDVSSGDKITVEVNNKAVTFPDAEPFIDENGRTQIPIRAVAEALGCEVKWDSGTRTAAITKGDIVISIGIGKNIMQVGREVVEMDTAAEIVDDRTYIPVRFVGEALGMKVNWVSR